MSPDARRVLLIDDSELAVEIQTMLLERNGFEVHACIDLAEVRDALAAFRPHVIMLDAHLGDATVEDAVGALRGADVPVLLYSGMVEDELAELTTRLGLHGYISKADPSNVVIVKLEAALKEAARPASAG